jgi:hypothetical protein
MWSDSYLSKHLYKVVNNWKVTENYCNFSFHSAGHTKMYHLIMCNKNTEFIVLLKRNSQQNLCKTFLGNHWRSTTKRSIYFKSIHNVLCTRYLTVLKTSTINCALTAASICHKYWWTCLCLLLHWSNVAF